MHTKSTFERTGRANPIVNEYREYRRYLYIKHSSLAHNRLSKIVNIKELRRRYKGDTNSVIQLLSLTLFY